MNRKGSIGQILTSFPSIIFLLLIVLAYILVSSFIVRDNIESYNLLDDFLDDYVIYENKLFTASELVDNYCDNKINLDKMKTILTENFEEKYGSGNIFVIASEYEEPSKVIAWGGLINPYINSEGIVLDKKEFRKLVDFEDKRYTKRKCAYIFVYLKETV